MSQFTSRVIILAPWASACRLAAVINILAKPQLWVDPDVSNENTLRKLGREGAAAWTGLEWDQVRRPYHLTSLIVCGNDHGGIVS